MYSERILELFKNPMNQKDTSCQWCTPRGDEVCCFATSLARGECALHILFI